MRMLCSLHQSKDALHLGKVARLNHAVGLVDDEEADQLDSTRQGVVLPRSSEGLAWYAAIRPLS